MGNGRLRAARDGRTGVAQLEELTRGAAIRGILPDAPVTVVDVTWYGSNCIELTYKDAAGHLGSELLYRDREPMLEIATAGRPWSFDGDGKLLRLVSEAYRIRLAYLFDPLLAVHTSRDDLSQVWSTAAPGRAVLRPLWRAPGTLHGCRSAGRRQGLRRGARRVWRRWRH